MAKAFRTAKEGRPGPVYVELPRDVIESEMEWIAILRRSP